MSMHLIVNCAGKWVSSAFVELEENKVVLIVKRASQAASHKQLANTLQLCVPE